MPCECSGPLCALRNVPWRHYLTHLQSTSTSTHNLQPTRICTAMFTLDHPYSELLRRLTALHHESYHYYKDTPSGGCGTQPEFRISVFITELLILIHTTIITLVKDTPSRVFGVTVVCTSSSMKCQCSATATTTAPAPANFGHCSLSLVR